MQTRPNHISLVRWTFFGASIFFFFHDGSLIHSVIYSLTFWVVVVAVVRDVSFETVFDPESEPPPPYHPSSIHVVFKMGVVGSVSCMCINGVSLIVKRQYEDGWKKRDYDGSFDDFLDHPHPSLAFPPSSAANQTNCLTHWTDFPGIAVCYLARLLGLVPSGFIGERDTLDAALTLRFPSIRLSFLLGSEMCVHVHWLHRSGRYGGGPAPMRRRTAVPSQELSGHRRPGARRRCGSAAAQHPPGAAVEPEPRGDARAPARAQ